VPYLRCYHHSLNTVDVLETQLKDEYDFDKPSTKTWIVTIEDKGSVSFPEELLQQLGWETGDEPKTSPKLSRHDRSRRKNAAG
jgi:hypothetical protein